MLHQIMHLCCNKKGCAHVIDKPDHKGGWLLMWCPQCEATTDHFCIPPPGTLLPKAGHRGIFNNATQFKTKKR